MSADQSQNQSPSFRGSPTGPWVAPPRAPSGPWTTPARQPRPVPRPSALNRRLFWRVAIFCLLLAGVAVRAYRDMSRPEEWAYWKDQYLSPSLKFAPLTRLDLDGSGHGRPALAVSGRIGAAAASLFRAALDQADLAPGDTVLLSSPGGDLDQAIIIGEIIRAHGLATAVGKTGGGGDVHPAYCASACVLAFAGGKPRLGIEGSMLGVHRFVTISPMDDPVAETQRVDGMVLGYMSKMGVASSILEAMSQTREVRWLPTREAVAMNLITDPLASH